MEREVVSNEEIDEEKLNQDVDFDDEDDWLTEIIDAEEFNKGEEEKVYLGLDIPQGQTLEDVTGELKDEVKFTENELDNEQEDDKYLKPVPTIVAIDREVLLKEKALYLKNRYVPVPNVLLDNRFIDSERIVDVIAVYAYLSIHKTYIEEYSGNMSMITKYFNTTARYGDGSKGKRILEALDILSEINIIRVISCDKDKKWRSDFKVSVEKKVIDEYISMQGYTRIYFDEIKKIYSKEYKHSDVALAVLTLVRSKMYNRNVSYMYNNKIMETLSIGRVSLDSCQSWLSERGILKIIQGGRTVTPDGKVRYKSNIFANMYSRNGISETDGEEFVEQNIREFRKKLSY